jgi:outer membrane protein assembly factor BamA
LSDSDDLAWVLVYRPGWRALDLRATIRTNGAEAYELRQELEFGSPRRGAAHAPRRRRAAPPVSRVDVEGLSPDETAAVRRRLSLREGEGFTTDGWQRDRLAITEYFYERDRLSARVRASHAPLADGAYVLTYRIAPGPITRLEVRGYAPDADTVRSLRDAWSRGVVEEFLGDELSDLVRIDLASRGYLGAEVTTRISPLPDAGRLAILDVTPGRRTPRRSIAFSGNLVVADGELRQALDGRGVEPRGWIEPSLLEAPVAALYHSRGYLAARATATRTITEDRATIVVSVDEGRRFAVGAVRFAGATSLGEPAARAGFGLAPGAPFSDAALASALNNVRVTYSRAGYLDADVAPAATVRPEQGVVDLAVAIEEGRPSALREIRVTGRDETSERLVNRVLDIPAGGPVDRVALDQGQQRLYNTGIFRTVDVDVRPVDGGESADAVAVDATVALEERAKYRLRYGVQFGPTTIDNITNSGNTAEPGATIDLQRRNLFGQGIVAGAGGVWSAEQHRVRATVSTATLRGRFVSTTFTIEHANQDRASDKGLQVVDRSARAVLEQRWKFGSVRRVELAYGFDVDGHRLELQATTGEALPLRGRVAGLNATVTYDSRDDRFNPRRGTFHTSRVETGAGLWLSDIAFGRYQLQHFAYYPVGTITLASGLRFGSLDVDDEREPASLLLFFKTGGGTSVRGYDTDSLTPGYVLGTPAGGKALLVLNEEVRVPLTRRFGVVGFVDAGNTFTALDAVSLRGLKVGAGAGLRLDTPVAVLRLDVALPVPRLPAGPRARWYVSIGQAF